MISSAVLVIFQPGASVLAWRHAPSVVPSEVLDSRVTRCLLCAADIPEEEARYWAKKLEQLNAMRDQDVGNIFRFLFLHILMS